MFKLVLIWFTFLLSSYRGVPHDDWFCSSWLPGDEVNERHTTNTSYQIQHCKVERNQQSLFRCLCDKCVHGHTGEDLQSANRDLLRMLIKKPTSCCESVMKQSSLKLAEYGSDFWCSKNQTSSGFKESAGEKVHVAFIGDSRSRQLFENVVYIYGRDNYKIERVKINEIQSDLFANRIIGNITGGEHEMKHDHAMIWNVFFERNFSSIDNILHDFSRNVDFVIIQSGIWFEALNKRPPSSIKSFISFLDEVVQWRNQKQPSTMIIVMLPTNPVMSNILTRPTLMFRVQLRTIMLQRYPYLHVWDSHLSSGHEYSKLCRKHYLLSKNVSPMLYDQHKIRSVWRCSDQFHFGSVVTSHWAKQFLSWSSRMIR